ncbi:hypothetical protein B0H15DRAFT_1020655 [Mycena belliarum]|uniref:Uncharacterized protein n=1 Tax=Mycena belliarum TaxID=1033014 RepID=A0AAD6XPP9_9AGAR|nr:hypothetical protein B0H15DRAFT_1020655 [Mycena belliae]
MSTLNMKDNLGAPSSIMDQSVTDSSGDLRNRIMALEMDLKQAQMAKEDAEADLEIHRAEAKDSEHALHIARNLASYGPSDRIIFVQPEDRDQGLLYRLAKGKGTSASVCRFAVRYNIDQLLQRPILHQWLQNGKLYRTAGEQQSSRFELFFDLLFVGMVHQLSEAAAEQPTGIGLVKYILTFAPAFSIWADVRDIANQFSNDDVTQRVYILWTMMLLVGYSNNASAIEFGKVEAEEGILREDSLTSMRWTLGFFVVAKLSRVVLSLVYALFLPMSRQPLIIGSLNAMVWALVFFIAIFTSLHVSIALVAIGIAADYALRIIGVLLYKTMQILGKKYDKRRQQRIKMNRQDSSPLSLEEDDVAVTPAAEKDALEEDPLEGIRTGNSSVTAVNEEAPLGDIKLCRNAAAKENIRFPAINIEHHVERLGAFVTVCLGEMVVSVFFTTSGTVGLNLESGRALLGLMIAFNLNWIYFGSQACKHFIHAIRRHWFTGFLFSALHLPLCMSIILASSSINRLITSPSLESELGGGVKWFFGAGLGVGIWTMATIGVLHKNLDDEEGLLERSFKPIRRTISRKTVFGGRYLAGLAMILVPLAKDLSSVAFLAIYMGITAFLIIEETISRIERREQELDIRMDGGPSEEAI